MAKSSQTGTQKKATKQAAHEYRKSGSTREKAIRKTESFLHGGRRYESTERKLKDSLKGIEKYTHSDKYKGLAEFERGGKAYRDSEDFKRLKDFGVGGKAFKDIEKFKELKDFGVGGKAYKDIEKFKGLKDFEVGGKAFKDIEEFKGLKPFEYGGKAYEDPNFYKEGLQGYEMAQKVLAPIQAQAMRNFGQVTLPGIVNQLGQESKGGSALRQALAASRENLEKDLFAQTSQLAAQYGSDISRMNVGERARQQELQQQTAMQRAGMNIGQLSDIRGLQQQTALQRAQMNMAQLGDIRGMQQQTALQKAGMNIGQLGDIRGLQQQTELERARMNIAQQMDQQRLQYGAASDIFAGKRAATLGLSDQQRSNLEYLNNLAMQSGFNLQGAGLGTAGGAFQPAYMQKGPSGPSTAATLGSGLLQAAGTAAGAYFGGPMGAAAGNYTARAISQPLFGTNQL